MSSAVDYRRQMVEDIASFTHDPLSHVLYCYPWGEGELAGQSGPNEWQREVLEKIGANLRAGVVLVIDGPKDRKYWIRLNSTIQHFNLPIDTWEMQVPAL